ncbi:uncharacterized protein LOC129393591 [Pan paniscus]|uniref:uncharacterized protein LOC129393591 n=1 Tax=Pan paniscus TaxID=9597 RepID=UPI002437025F|nr:uncharacterized protein LOC129393591 [Pan paniscus]
MPRAFHSSTQPSLQTNSGWAQGSNAPKVQAELWECRKQRGRGNRRADPGPASPPGTGPVCPGGVRALEAAAARGTGPDSGSWAGAWTLCIRKPPVEARWLLRGQRVGRAGRISVYTCFTRLTTRISVLRAGTRSWLEASAEDPRRVRGPRGGRRLAGSAAPALSKSTRTVNRRHGGNAGVCYPRSCYARGMASTVVSVRLSQCEWRKQSLHRERRKSTMLSSRSLFQPHRDPVTPCSPRFMWTSLTYTSVSCISATSS